MQPPPPTGICRAGSSHESFIELGALAALTGEHDLLEPDLEDVLRSLAQPAPEAAPPDRSASDVHEPSICWGSQLVGSSEHCDTTFRDPGRHFVEKFCDRCRANGILFPCTRVRAIRADTALFLSPVGSLWNRGREGITYRMLNHTASCDPPRLIIFDSSPETAYGSDAWEQMPAAWSSDGYIRLWPSKMTLVPQRPRKKFVPRPVAASASSAPSAKRVRGNDTDDTASDSTLDGTMQVELPMVELQNPPPMASTMALGTVAEGAESQLPYELQQLLADAQEPPAEQVDATKQGAKQAEAACCPSESCCVACAPPSVAAGCGSGSVSIRRSTWTRW
jgi:hypothetical protein